MRRSKPTGRRGLRRRCAGEVEAVRERIIEGRMNVAEEYELSPVADGTDSPLAHARLHRQLTVEEAARRAGLQPDEVRWLEEGRVYRFRSPDHALMATILYASALGIDHDEALGLAGLPVPPRPLRRNPWTRLEIGRRRVGKERRAGRAP